MALVSTAEVQAWVAGDGQVGSQPAIDSTLLTACIAAAGEEIIEETSRIWEKATFTEVLDGSAAAGANREILFLRRFPVTYPADALTVTENGVSLVVAAGYSTSAKVIVKGAGFEDQCRLFRNAYASWAPGIQNITVGYSAGFTTIPERIKFVAKELAWLYYQEGRKVGLDNVAQGGSSRGLAHKLSQLSRDILARARRW